MDKYKDKIVYETELDISLLNKTQRGRRIIKDARSSLKDAGDIWLIKFWGTKLNIKPLVDFLYSYHIDVFDIEYGSITKIYCCKEDDYRIRNSVVFSVFRQKK